MAQTTSFTIANDSGLAVRVRLNEVLAALVSQNAGDTPPPVTVPGLLWFDTSQTPAVLRRRNATDSGWDRVLTGDGNLAGLANTAAARSNLGVPATETVLLKAENLAGLADAAAARANLGLGPFFLPPGIIGWFARSTAPAGWLKANGAAISRTTYAALFAEIGITFGAGDGSTTFALPDLRGEFLRGWDDGRGIDAGRALGSGQLDQLQGHLHDLSNQVRTNGGGGTGSGNLRTNSDGSASITAGAPYAAEGANGTPRVGAETRPRNLALLACIKF